MPLDFRSPPTVPTLNVILYGAPGTGKSVGALSAPGPILYLNAEGPNAAMFARRQHPGGHILEAPVTGTDTLLEAINFASDGCKTVVLDSLGATFQALMDSVTGGAKPTLPQYGDVTTAIERFCRHMRDLPVNFIAVAHEQTVKDEESGVIERLPFTGTSNPQLGVKLMAQADIVGYCGRVKPDNGDAQYLAQLFPGGGRRGKDRTGTLGENRAVDLTEWLTTYIQAIEPATPAKAEKEAVTA
jgi:AAA domain